MKYLIAGSGGREHAIFWRLMNDGSSNEVYCTPGNGGIPDEFRLDAGVDDFEAIEKYCIQKKIDMVVVGPEAPLAAGIVDYLEEKKIPAFGPSGKAAALESSKLFAKKIMNICRVPTAEHEEFNDRAALLDYINGSPSYPMVLKLDGLAAGKGVGILNNKDEALAFINEFIGENTRVLREEHLNGEEASVLGVSDGVNVYPFIAAQDYKRIYEGDKGPNTGGMGSYAPAPVVDSKRLEDVKQKVLQPVVDGMRKEGIPFKGILYAGLMIKGDDMKVLEFNVRFGDPEVQALMPLLEGRLGDIFQASVSGNLKPEHLVFKKKHAITVVISSGGYPGLYEKGKEITGLDSLPDDILVFHAGTKAEGGKLYTNGGRVLNITAQGDSLREARDRVYYVIDKVRFDGAFYRKDIAHRALG